MSDAAEVELEVDGERFVVRRSTASDGGYDFEWVTGPNPGYGFSIGAPIGYAKDSEVDAAAPSEVELTQHARRFLAMIDRVTGYVAD
jgi:hypothetical protein